MRRRWFARARMLATIEIAMMLAGAASCSGTPDAEPERAPDEDAPYSEVHLAAEAIEAAGITIGHAEQTRLIGTSVIPAEVRLDPTRTAHIAPLVAGRITEVHAALGDEVHAGDVLALVTSADAADLAAAITEARARLTVAEAATERLGELGEAGITARRSMEEAIAERDRARAQLAGLTQRRGVVGSRGRREIALVAPLDGVVVDLHAVPGETIEPAQVVFTVADTRHVWVIGRAPELEIGSLRVGMPATLRLHAYPSESFSGTVSLLSPMLDPTTRTLEVRMELDDESGRLRAGLFGTLALGDADPTTVVPETALARLEGGDVVFVPGASEGTFRAVSVAVGARSEGFAEVVRGIDAGDAIVSRGAFVLKSELLRAELSEEGQY